MVVISLSQQYFINDHMALHSIFGLAVRGWKLSAVIEWVVTDDHFILNQNI